MYSILNMSLAGFLTLKVCPAVRRTIHHFICLLGASSSARGGGGLPWLWAAQTSPTACSLCRSEEENARKVQRRHAFSHGQRWAASRAVIRESLKQAEWKSQSFPNEV